MSATLRDRVVWLVVAAVACGWGGQRAALAQSDGRPILFEGEATADDVYVRSGDSLNHYTVCKLEAGRRVQVLAERGEWYEIVPPAEAFSLISGDYVDSADGKHGVVNGTNVRVRTGSLLNKNKYTVQTLLGKGSEVTILGKNADGFLRIVPPANATLWINRAYVQRVPDELRKLEADTRAAGTGTAGTTGSGTKASWSGGASRVAGPSDDHASAPGANAGVPSTKLSATRPSASRATENSGTTVPPAFSGSLAQLERTEQVEELARIDAGVNAELAKPVLERQLRPFLKRYQALSAQDEDEMAQRYAKARATQLSDMLALVDTVRKMRRLEATAASRRRAYQAERAGIRTVAPSAPSGIDAEGVLRRSSLYPQGSPTERLRLIDVSTPVERTVAYVEIPAHSPIDAEAMIEKYVGVRASAKRWQQGGVDPVPILVAQELVLLETPTERGAAAEKGMAKGVAGK